MPNVMAALPNIGGALYKSSLIPFLVPCRKDWLTTSARVPGSNTANIGERKTSTQSEFYTGQNSLIGARAAENVHIIMYQPRRRPNIVQSLLTSVERRRCSNETNTRYPLKFAGVPQSGKPISAANGPKFTILWRHVDDILLFKTIFRLSINALIAKIQPDKAVRWCQDGDFLAMFCEPVFSTSRVQHISDLHSKFTLRPCVEIC